MKRKISSPEIAGTLSIQSLFRGDFIEIDFLNLLRNKIPVITDYTTE